ncbi:MAG: hypothetical protein JW808_10115 [Victivallales bacterium]|nr:hypothetical protein [Victivallales bacterium]
MLKKIWHNPRLRNKAVLGVVLFVLAILLIYSLLTREPPPPEGAIRVVICEDCGETYATRIKDIDDPGDKRNKCRVCGGKLALAWKCRECKFEFPENKIASDGKLDNTMKKYQAVVNANRCPNCGSLATAPMSKDELK